jgi:hypothetical protein
MNIIVANSDNSVIYAGTIISQDVDSINIGDVCFSNQNITVFEVVSIPDDYVPQKYCYTTTAGFTINPNYATPQVSVVTPIVIPPTPAELTIMSALADMYVAIAALTPTVGGAS